MLIFFFLEGVTWSPEGDWSSLEENKGGIIENRLPIWGGSLEYYRVLGEIS